MTLLPHSSGHGGPTAEPAALLSWVRRRFVRWLTGTGMKETRWSYTSKGELLVPVEARGSEEQELALHDTAGATLDLHFHFPAAGLPIGAAALGDEDEAFPPGKTGQKLWAPADAEGDEKGGKLQSRAGMKRALLVDLHQLFGRRSLGGPASGAVMLLGVDAHCAAWVRRIGFHSQRLRQLVDDGRGVESGCSFEGLRDDVSTSFQETGFQAALFFDGVIGGRAGAVAYFGEITNATAEDHTSDAPDVAAAVQALSSLGKLSKAVALPRVSPPRMSASALSSLLADADKAPDTEATPSRATGTGLASNLAGVVRAPTVKSLDELLQPPPPLPAPMLAPPPVTPPVGPSVLGLKVPGTIPAVFLDAEVGQTPPRPELHPQYLFMQTDAYKEAVRQGWPELTEIGDQAGGMYTFEAIELGRADQDDIVRRVGTAGGVWWSRHPPPTNLAHFRERDAVLVDWKKDDYTHDIHTITIPKGKKGTKAWIGMGMPAFERDQTTKIISHVYRGDAEQIHCYPTHDSMKDYPLVSEKTSWAPPTT